jgi:hypothetical protein
MQQLFISSVQPVIGSEQKVSFPFNPKKSFTFWVVAEKLQCSIFGLIFYKF